jgi:hypothetical protein
VTAVAEYCIDCDYAYDGLRRVDLADALRAFAPAFRARLSDTPDARLRSRPEPDVWSPLEYACHVRDVFRVQRERILLALVDDTPDFVPMRRDERALEERYNDQDAATVAGELAQAAEALAATLDALDDSGWVRTGVYNWPERQVRTVEWIGRHTVHEGRHHLHDVAQQLD